MPTTVISACWQDKPVVSMSRYASRLVSCFVSSNLRSLADQEVGRLGRRSFNSMSIWTHIMRSMFASLNRAQKAMIALSILLGTDKFHHLPSPLLCFNPSAAVSSKYFRNTSLNHSNCFSVFGGMSPFRRKRSTLLSIGMTRSGKRKCRVLETATSLVFRLDGTTSNA